MKVLLLTSHLEPGGISRYVINCAEGALQHGVSVLVGSRGGRWEEKLSQKGISHFRFSLHTKSICSPQIFFALQSLRKIYSTAQFDLIHANTRITQFLAYLFQKYEKVPYVSTFHGFYRPRFFRRLFPCFGTQTIAVSNEVKKHLVNDFRCESQNISVIYNGIDPLQYRPVRSKNEAQKFFQISGYPMIGMAARFSQEKNHRLIVDALQKLSERYPNIHCVFLGTGRLKKNLRQYAEKNKIIHRISFLEHIEINEFLDLLDVFLLPSLYEGFGFSIIEAQARNIPVIGSAVGGITEIIENEISGILLKDFLPETLAHAVTRCLDDDMFRKNLVQNASLKVTKRFSQEIMIAQTIELYNKILRVYKRNT